MSIEYHHRSIPPVDSDDIFDADLDYLIEGAEDPDHRKRLQDFKDAQPELYRRLLRHAAVEAEGNGVTQDKLLNFGMYILEIIGRGLEHGKPPETS